MGSEMCIRDRGQIENLYRKLTRYVAYNREIMENKEVQALDSEYLLSLMKQANTDKDAAFELGK